MIWVLLFAGCLCATAIVSFRRPGAAIGLMLVMFGLEQLLQAQSTMFVTRSNLVNVGIGVVAVIAAAKVLLSDARLLWPTRLQTLTLLLFGFAFTSSLWTIAPDAFDARFKSQWPYFVLYFCVGPVLCSHPRACEDAAKSTIILGIPILVGLAFLCEWTTRGVKLSTPVVEGGIVRLYTPPLAAASCAAVVSILTLAIMPRKWFWRLICVAALILGTYIIIRTQSRGQLAAFCIVATLVYPATNRAASGKGLIQLFLILVTLLTILYGVFIFVGESGTARWQERHVNSAIEGRTEMVRKVFFRWLDSGVDAWAVGMGESSSFSIAGFYVHNVPVEVLCELGFVGAFLFVWFFWDSLKNAVLFAAQIPHDWDQRRPALGFVGVFLFMSMLMFKEGTLCAIPNVFFVGILIGRVAMQHQEWNVVDYRGLFLENAEGNGDVQSGVRQNGGVEPAPAQPRFQPYPGKIHR